jgi:hypothetical protein
MQEEASMASEIRRLFFLCLALSPCLTIGCGSKGPTQLCDGFQSYENAQSVRNKLTQSGVIGQWHEESKGLDPKDRRPPYTILTFSGPYKLSGVDGHLRLTLYNDRLMETQFTTGNGPEYLAALRKGNAKIPKDSWKRTKINRRTEFVYFTYPDGTYRFLWTDLNLEAEENEWISSFA